MYCTIQFEKNKVMFCSVLFYKLYILCLNLICIEALTFMRVGKGLVYTCHITKLRAALYIKKI